MYVFTAHENENPLLNIGIAKEFTIEPNGL